ncbi:MAG: DegV family protein [Chloroflexi bacterium]|nr:DegV family protein [Chloroflexota bacterium]
MTPREDAVAVVTDSTCDLPPSIVKSLGITVVPLKVHFGAKTYLDDVDLTADQFYELQKTSSVIPATSQPSVGDFIKAYTKLSITTKSIISIHLSSKLSGTYNAAMMAREAVFTRCQVEVIDSQSASLGLGFLAMTAAEAANNGANLRDIANLVRRVIPQIHIMLFVDTLDYLQRGGRIGRAQAFVGSVLNVKPLLKLEDGEIQPVERVRTRAKALERLYEFIELFPHIERMALVYSTVSDDIDVLMRRIEPFVPAEKVMVGQLGPVLGAHLGPGAIGVIVDQGTHNAF